MNSQQILSQLEALGVPVDVMAEFAIFLPVLMFVATIVTYVVTSRRQSKLAAHAKLAKGLMSGARRRTPGLTQEEILARLQPDTEPDGGASKIVQTISEILLKAVNFNKEETRKKLIQAGERDPRALSRYIIQRGMGMVLAPLLIWFAAPYLGLTGLYQALISATGILVGGIIVDVRLDKMVTARREQISNQLPVLLDLLTIYLEAGSSFDVALARSSHALKISFPVAAAEIFHLRRDLEMSIDREGTLREFAKRINTQTSKTFVAIVVQSEKRGNAIAPALRRLARDARREVMMNIEKKAQKIPTVMQLPMFLFILPAIFASVIGPAAVQIANIASSQ